MVRSLSDSTGFGQVLPERSGLDVRIDWIGACLRWGRNSRQSLAGDAGDGIAECRVLRGDFAALVERRVVVVAGGVGFVVSAIAVGAVHETEAGAPVKHVHAYGVALAQHPFILRGVAGSVGGVVVLTPMIEPAGPVLAGHEWAFGTKLLKRGEVPLGIAGAEVDDGGKSGKRAIGNLLRTVGGIEQRFRRRQAGFQQR